MPGREALPSYLPLHIQQAAAPWLQLVVRLVLLLLLLLGWLQWRHSWHVPRVLLLLEQHHYEQLADPVGQG